MTTMKNLSMAAIGAAVIALGTASTARAVSLSKSIDVLWYGHSSTYNAKMSELAAGASSFDPWGDGSLE